MSVITYVGSINNALLGLHTYSLLFRSPRLLSVSLFVCPASDLENYARYVQNFITFIRNPGRRARIWHQILHWR